MAKLGGLLVIMLLGAVIMAPIIMALELDQMPWDFTVSWHSQTYHVPVIWSLCASGAMTLLYSLYRR
jgi:hypothetical protein